MELTTITLTVIALLGTQAILADIVETVPNVIHSLPFKLIGVYAILYGFTKSHVMAAKGIVVFATLVLAMVLLQGAIVHTSDPYADLEKVLA